MTRIGNTLWSGALRALEHRHLPYWLGALAFAVASPAIRIGLLLDDYLHLASLRSLPHLQALRRSPFDLFDFMGRGRSLSSGFLPWWTSPGLRIAFFRPFTGLTHALDFALWPNQPHWMHIHSLLWLMATVVLAAKLYRRLAPPSLPAWVPGLAGLAFAVDATHAIPASWIADRYTLITGVFAIATILVYDRWRREEWQPGRWLAPLCLGLGLLAGESALSGAAYLLSYAIFLDSGSLRRRLGALVPSALVGLLWGVAYRTLGYGTSHSALYIDPGCDPLKYLQALVQRAPLLLMGQLGFPPSDLAVMASRPVAHGLWLWAVAGLAVAGAMVWPILVRERTARFWALGMVLALLPASATLTSDRLLLLTSLGGAASIAIFVATALGKAGGSGSPIWRRLARPLAYLLLVIHLAWSPLLFLKAISEVAGLHALSQRVATTFPADPQIAGQQAIVIQPPSVYLTGLAEVTHALQGQPTPDEILVLASGIYPIEIERSDANTLIVRPDGGFLLPPDAGPPGRLLPAILPQRSWWVFDSVFREPGEPFPSKPILRGGIIIEILTRTEDARPAVVSFRFPVPLEDPRWRWVRWRKGGFAEFLPPPVGHRVRLVSYLE